MKWAWSSSTGQYRIERCRLIAVQKGSPAARGRVFDERTQISTFSGLAMLGKEGDVLELQSVHRVGHGAHAEPGEEQHEVAAQVAQVGVVREVRVHRPSRY